MSKRVNIKSESVFLLISAFSGNYSFLNAQEIKAKDDFDLKEWNIVFITSDEHNPKIMGCAGNKVIQTPAMDRLAKEGVFFSNAYSCTPVSAPTRQTIITGLYPQEHGQVENRCKFDPRIPTWAAYLKSKGYLTACIGKTHSYTADNELGFDFRIEHPAPAKNNWQTLPIPEADKKVYNDVSDNRFRGAPLPNDSVKFDGLVVKESIKWIGANKDKKFFIHCSLLQPHWPWWSPEKFYMMYDPKKIDFPTLKPGEIDFDFHGKKNAEQFGWISMTEEQHRLARARYYGSVSYVDQSVQQILDLLDKLNLTKKTIVIYSSDHGDMIGEKGLWFKNLMYDASARVPLLVRMPGVLKPGTKYEGLISHVDYFPSIMGLAGIGEQLPTDLSGMNLSTSIIKNKPSRKYIFCVDNIPIENTANAGQEMVRSNQYKYIYYRKAPQGEKEILFDMISDPDETKNIVNDPRMRKIVDEHRSAMQTHLKSLKKQPFPMLVIDRKPQDFNKNADKTIIEN